jgi:hypothetical protein
MAPNEPSKVSPKIRFFASSTSPDENFPKKIIVSGSESTEESENHIGITIAHRKAIENDSASFDFSFQLKLAAREGNSPRGEGVRVLSM